jgi:hypothetical protein
MNLKRTAIIGVSGAAFAAWLSAAIAPSRPPITSVTTPPAPVDVSGAALASEIARLRERLRPTPAPSEATRNPFMFRSTRRVPVVPVASPPAAAGVAATRVGEERTGLRLTLAGVAEDPGPSGAPPVRTAIISGNGQVVLAREGDIVADRATSYRVAAIAADSVDLVDEAAGTLRRLALK